jgi:hypothetical protein
VDLVVGLGSTVGSDPAPSHSTGVDSIVDSVADGRGRQLSLIGLTSPPARRGGHAKQSQAEKGRPSAGPSSSPGLSGC